MKARPLAAALLILFCGCSPTRTAGTSGKSAKELAVLSIPQLPGELHVQIKSIQFDGAGDDYDIGGGRDFYLLPGDHTAAFLLVAHIPGVAGWFVPSSATTFPGPKGVHLGAFTAGKTYELASSVKSFARMMQDGRVSLVREKVK